MQAHKIIGRGSFGAVIEPALPNVDEHGIPLIFGPDKVTKVMLKKNNYQKTLADAALIADTIPSLGMNVIPYRRTYTKQNIAAIPKMQEYIDETPDSNGVFMILMPNLGTDLWSLSHNKAQMIALRATVPPTQMIRQVLKIMRVVKAIGSAGYIHADIRESNVLCSNTGELTIIDFDWLMTPVQIQKDYPVYFYCHPPESMFLLDNVKPIDQYLTSKPNRTAFRDAVYDVAVDYMRDNGRDEFWSTIQLHGTTRDDFARKITQNMVELYDTASRTSPHEALKRFREIYYNTTDSFGLAVALKAFLVEYFYKQEDTDTRRFLRDTLFTAMTNTASKQRMKIERAIIMLQDYARVHFPDIELGEEISFTGEVARLGAMVNLMSERRRRSSVRRKLSSERRKLSSERRKLSSERRKLSSERRTLRQQVEDLALLTKYRENLSTLSPPLLPPSPSSSGRRTGSSSDRRKTRKNSSRS